MGKNNREIVTSAQENLIVERLKQLNKTQTWLAKQCGVTPGQISHIIMGTRKPSLRLLNSIATILELNATELLNRIA